MKTFFANNRAFSVKNRRVAVTLLHLMVAALANYLAFLLRFDLNIPSAYQGQFFSYLPCLLSIRLALCIQAGLYKGLWRYFGVNDLKKIIRSVTFGSVLFALLVRYLPGGAGYPLSIYILDWVLLIMLESGVRLVIRAFKGTSAGGEKGGKRVLIIGAGDAGEMIVRDMKNNPKYAYKPVGFIDDDPYKKGLMIHGVPIFGGRPALPLAVTRNRPNEILIAMPGAGHKAINGIYELCKSFNLPITTLPGLGDIMDGKVSVSQIKALQLEDLLQRAPVRTGREQVKELIRGKTILVTGAGGSIGQELCRQIMDYRPLRLVLFDRYENGLFAIDCALRKKTIKPNGCRAPEIVSFVGDMRDEATLEHLFSVHAPQIVFHAAAHKHVPLMEQNPLEAVRNNIFGTSNLITAASRHYVKDFVMISTDKAVNPTSIMGATKRVAEFLAMRMNSSSLTRFTTVRFGNVLGSNGSVVPTFREQLKRGGPLTITHPDVKRFFMLTEEAVHLVLVAAAAGKGGEIFVLEMGEQIKVLDLALNMIKLSGLVPYEEIKIEFMGLRPGEKLYEELFDETEEVVPSPFEKLRMAVPGKVPSREELEWHLSALRDHLSRRDPGGAVSELRKIVPNFVGQEDAAVQIKNRFFRRGTFEDRS
ncbi:MAG: nucleoside-diphosphate sugar epimerase/dehydratase [Nitrospiraceae bacterium]|nr:nucleoside-diphosphate sugar epimerase/dehydratase [Nitrospiraceae bacterium]